MHTPVDDYLTSQTLYLQTGLCTFITFVWIGCASGAGIYSTFLWTWSCWLLSIDAPSADVAHLYSSYYFCSLSYCCITRQTDNTNSIAPDGL